MMPGLISGGGGAVNWVCLHPKHSCPLPSAISRALMQYPALWAPSRKPALQLPHFADEETGPEKVRHLAMATQQVTGRTYNRI